MVTDNAPSTFPPHPLPNTDPEDLPPHPSLNSLPYPQPDLPPTSSPDRTEGRPSLAERVCTIFPPGFESTSLSSTGAPYAFTPHLLFDMLRATHNGNQHVEHTVVNSVWYCKQTKSAKHEFIVIHIGDLKIPGLENCIALDRNKNAGSSPKSSGISSGLPAADTFRISYDGDLNRFLGECKLTPYVRLEEMHLRPHESLPLLNLVTLVVHISRQYPTYHALGTNCYWFTGLIWECMRVICPEAKHTAHLPGKKGKMAFARIIPNPIHVRTALRGIQNTPDNEPSHPGRSQDRNHATGESGEAIDMEEIRVENRH